MSREIESTCVGIEMATQEVDAKAARKDKRGVQLWIKHVKLISSQNAGDPQVAAWLREFEKSVERYRDAVPNPIPEKVRVVHIDDQFVYIEGLEGEILPHMPVSYKLPYVSARETQISWAIEVTFKNGEVINLAQGDGLLSNLLRLGINKA